MRVIESSDPLQAGYRYAIVAPTGRAFDPSFTPELTPRAMLELGVFDGWYFEGYHDEFPRSWFEHARLGTKGPDIRLNCFAVHASQSRAVWQRNGWIHQDDPRGWFQWYCRYYLGRRHPDDARQIVRWRAAVRHRAQLTRHCGPGELTCRPRQRQALLHWAYDSRV